MTGSSSTAAERLYHTPELFVQVLKFLDDRTLVKIASLERALLPRVSDVLYRDVTWWEYKRIQKDSPCASIYYRSIRSFQLLDADYYDDITHHSAPEDLCTGDHLAKLLEQCPKLQSIVHHPANSASRFLVLPRQTGQGVIHVSHPQYIQNDPKIVLRQPSPVPGFILDITYHLIFCTSRQHETTGGRYGPLTPFIEQPSLVDGRVNRLTLGPIRTDLDSLLALIKSRLEGDVLPFEEIDAKHTAPFTFDQFEAFAREVGGGMTGLGLDNYFPTWQSPAWQTPSSRLISVDRLGSIVDIVKQHMPRLKTLSFMLSGTREVDSFDIGEESIPCSNSHRGGTLTRITITLPDIDEEHWCRPPIFAIARNLACLGAPSCFYEVRTWEDLDPSSFMYDPRGGHVRLTAIVRWFQQLPEHKWKHMRTANFEELGFQPLEYDFDALRDTLFMEDGRPLTREEQFFYTENWSPTHQYAIECDMRLRDQVEDHQEGNRGTTARMLQLLDREARITVARLWQQRLNIMGAGLVEGEWAIHYLSGLEVMRTELEELREEGEEAPATVKLAAEKMLLQAELAGLRKARAEAEQALEEARAELQKIKEETADMGRARAATMEAGAGLQDDEQDDQ